jgi:AcrR family transcriptional regulator
MATGEPALRADARRNYDRLLEAARECLAEQGTDASLRDVARRAGLGIGTLYRHFPTREALLEAVTRQRFDTLRDRAVGLRDEASPTEAVTAWLRDFVTSAKAYRGLPASVLAALQDDESELHASCAAMRGQAARLLTRAQKAGEIRADLTSTELFTLAAGVAWAGEHSSAKVDRLLALVMEGLAA